MTLVLNLTPELEQRLTLEAAKRGVTSADCAVHLLDQGLPRSSAQQEKLEEAIDDVFQRRRSALEELAKGALDENNKAAESNAL